MAQGSTNAGNAAFKDKVKPTAVRTANIIAARSVADAIRTSLGPRGMDKMIQTGKGETIITNDQRSANTFTADVDAAAVLVNTSSRFVDGGEFGFGAEIGISTQKLHARGPMGLAEMTSSKYIVAGAGQIRP